jgi:hypothetical protein
MKDWVELPWPAIVRTETAIEGEIIYIDGFGNLFTNIRTHDLEEPSGSSITVTIGDLSIAGVASHYAAVEPGQYVALINSWGLLEIAIYRESAKRRSGAIVGDKVKVTLVP